MLIEAQARSLDAEPVADKAARPRAPILKLLAAPMAPTAILPANNNMTLGVLQAPRDAALRCPTSSPSPATTTPSGATRSIPV